MKQKLIDSLGTFGVIIYFIACTLFGILPAIMIGKSLFASLIIVSVQQLIPISSCVFWVWGLFGAIAGKQDLWAYIYYVMFVVIFAPFFISTILDIIQKRK